MESECNPIELIVWSNSSRSRAIWAQKLIVMSATTSTEDEAITRLLINAHAVSKWRLYDSLQSVWTLGPLGMAMVGPSLLFPPPKAVLHPYSFYFPAEFSNKFMLRFISNWIRMSFSIIMWKIENIQTTELIKIPTKLHLIWKIKPKLQMHLEKSSGTTFTLRRFKMLPLWLILYKI